MEYDSRVNEKLMQTTEEKVDSSKALDASLVIIESNGTESQKQDTSSRSGNDAHVNDADIRPYKKMKSHSLEVQRLDDNVAATGQQHTEKHEFQIMKEDQSLESENTSGNQDHSNEQSSSKLVPKVVPLAVKTATSRQEMGLTMSHLT
ncbi:hypothetical protein Tco_0716834 [Tanacetum coccineum]